MKIVKKIPGYLGAIKRHYKIVFRRLTLKRVINLLVLGTEMILKRGTLKSRPAFAKIEASSACNLKCDGCRQGLPLMEIPPSNLSCDDLRTILDRMGEYLLEVVFYIWGEPLMNKDLPKLVAIVHDHNISAIISTNLHFLTEDMSHRLLENKLDKMIFCLDGWSQESYSSIRIGGDFETARSNIERFVKLKAETNSARPYLEWQYVVTDRNKRELAEAEKIADEWGIDRFVQLVDWSKRLSDEEYFEGLHKTRAKMRAEINRCFWLWSSVAVQVDGSVFPCCHVANKPLERRIYGNILQDDLGAVWNSQKYRRSRALLRTRRSVDEGDLICSTCMTPPIYTGCEM